MLNLLSKFFSKTQKDEELILEYFKDAIDFRYPIYLDFLHANQVAYQANASCIYITSALIRFQLRFERDYIPAKGMELGIFFVIDKNNKKIPCSFTSRVVESEKDKEETIFVDIEVPTSVTHSQRRNNVRIPIRNDEIPNFKVWSGREVEVLEGEEKRRKLTWEVVDRDHVRLIDISAGGIMLSLSKKAEIAADLQSNALFLCSGNFYSIHNPGTSLLLVSKARRITDNLKDKNITIGLQFVRWAQVSDKGTNWVGVDDYEGVSLISSWIRPLISRLANSKK